MGRILLIALIYLPSSLADGGTRLRQALLRGDLDDVQMTIQRCDTELANCVYGDGCSVYDVYSEQLRKLRDVGRFLKRIGARPYKHLTKNPTHAELPVGHYYVIGLATYQEPGSSNLDPPPGPPSGSPQVPLLAATSRKRPAVAAASEESMSPPRKGLATSRRRTSPRKKQAKIVHPEPITQAFKQGQRPSTSPKKQPIKQRVQGDIMLFGSRASPGLIGFEANANAMSQWTRKKGGSPQVKGLAPPGGAGSSNPQPGFGPAEMEEEGDPSLRALLSEFNFDD